MSNQPPLSMNAAAAARRAAIVAASALLAAGAAAQDASHTLWPRDPAKPDIQRIGTPPLRVMDIASAGETIWVATRNAGVFGVKPGSVLHLDVGRPLPSAVTWQVQPLGDSLLIGTSQGAVQVDLSTMSARSLKPSGTDQQLVERRPVDFIRVSPVDKRPLMQSRLATGSPSTSTQWRAELGAAPRTIELPKSATITTTGADPQGDCLLVAGTTTQAFVAQLWFASLCANDAQSRHVTIDLKDWRDAIGVSAVALDPVSARPVLAVVRGEMRTPSALRYSLLELAPDGTLRRHCSNAEFAAEVTGLLSDKARGRLTVAVYGEGIELVECRAQERRPQLVSGPELRWATALAIDTNDPRRLLVGTDTGLFDLQASSTENDALPWKSKALLVAQGAVLAPNAWPTDLSSDGQRALLAAPKQGVLELERGGQTWRITRTWPAAERLPAGVYGEARYADGDEIAVLVRSQGVFVVSDSESRWLDRKAVSSHPHVLGHAVDHGRGIWAALGSTPAADTGGVRWYPRADTDRPIDVRLTSAMTEPSGALLPWPDGSVWVASRAGVLRVDPSGTVTRLSRSRAQALFRSGDNPALVGVVGASIERWTGDRFEPVRFAIPARYEAMHGPVGHPIDLTIDARGRWTILFSSGQIVLLDSERRFEALFGPVDGVPASARRLVDSPSKGELLIGTMEEGLFVFKRQR